ncbi:MAG: DUF3306 domain-containing protein [Rhodospirillales bacterium]|nr:DUF3306 domain-containing protein [Rhodospirillales bacterium]
MSDEKRTFLARWSRRKLDGRAGVRLPEEQRGEPADSHTQPDAPAPVPDYVEPQKRPTLFDLPDIDSLGPHSDFAGFLRPEVPAALQQLALRKLWRSDPVLANLDGLNDYDCDFSQKQLGEIVRTAYRVGKGLIKADEGEAETAEPLELKPPSDNEGDGDSGGSNT